jgi:Sensors of blue-light using FAD
MIRLTYLSQECAPLSADALLALVTECHRNNSAKGLTGMLLYGNGTFLQVIEGEDAAVDQLMTGIERDPRHTKVKVLLREAVSSRHYADWSMGFERVTDRTLQEIPGLRNFGLRNFNVDYLSGHGNVVEKLLERHRGPHWDPLIRELDARDKLIAEMQQELSRAKQDHEIVSLILQTVVEVAKDGRLDDAHLELCRSALRSNAY